MSNGDLFDKELRQRFENFEPEPPAAVWSAIEQGLVASAPHRLVAPWIYRVAATIAVLAVTAFSYLYFVSGDQHVRSLADQRVPAEAADPAGDRSGVRSDDRSGDALRSGEAAPSADLPVLAGTTTVAGSAGVPTAGMEGITARVPARALAEAGTTPAMDFLAGNQPRFMEGIMPVLASHAHPSMQGSVRSTGNIWTQTDRLAFAPASSGSAGTFSLGAFVAPQYNDRRVSGGGLASGIPFSSLEEEALTYSFGLTGSIRLSKRLTVQTGATYLNVAQEVKDISALTHPERMEFYDPNELPAFGHPQNIATSLGTINFNDPTLYFEDLGSNRIETTKWPLDIPEPKLLEALGFGLTQRFSFVEVPVIFRYTLYERQLGLHLKAGFAANFLVNNEVLLVSDAHRGVVGQTAGLRDHYYSGIGGLVMTLPLSQRLQLFVEPTGQIFLNPMGRDDGMAGSTIKAFPYNFSVYSGLSYRI
jgi:hypothetical protein